jgi:hypothetical protein
MIAKSPLLRLRRRWVVLAIVVVAILATLRLLIQPLALESYRLVDPQTLDVLGHGTRSPLTQIAGVTETAATVTISVNVFTFEPLPHTDAGYPIEVPIQLVMPLGTREVIDGSTGQPIVASD